MIPKADPKRKEKDAWIAHLSKSSPLSVVTTDEDKVVVAAQKPLGVIKYRGLSVTMWAMTDPAGAIASGGDRQLADLAVMNKLGANAVRYAPQMNAMESDWRQKVEAVRKATAQSATEIKKVQAALPAMRQLRSTDGGKVFESVEGYLDALRSAESKIGPIRSAQSGLKQAASKLQSDEFWQQANDMQNQVKKDDEDVEAKKDEMKRAKELAGGILDVVEKVVKQDWADLAAKALEYARDKAIDASVEAEFGRDLAELQAKLDKAKSDLKNLTIQAYAKAVEASRAGLEKAAQDLDNAKGDFRRALEKMEELETHASDVLHNSAATKDLGAMLDERAKQLSAVETARTACENYARSTTSMHKGTMLVSNKYGAIGSWLNEAAAADPKFDRSKPYAKTLERSALSNAVELGRWIDWLGGVHDQCNKSLAWLADTAATGPMVHFERAVAIAKEALHKG